PGRIPGRIEGQPSAIAVDGVDDDARVTWPGRHHVAGFVEREAEDVETARDVRHGRGSVGRNHAAPVSGLTGVGRPSGPTATRMTSAAVTSIRSPWPPLQRSTS